MIEVTLSGPGRNALGSEPMQRTLDALRAAAGAPLLLVERATRSPPVST